MNVVILGAEGFVGKNLFEDLAETFSTHGSNRKTDGPAKPNSFYFDLLNPNTWEVLLLINPDVIINCIGYGVVKNQTDVKQMIDVNYLYAARLYDYIGKNLPIAYLIHIGTAFEYDLRQNQLTEESRCTPLTYYGLSKYMTSNYLLQSRQIKAYSIIRPFNMFGPYEHVSKIIPTLITAQRTKTPVPLSEGLQKRDYVFVKDLSTLVTALINHPSKRESVINAGSGRLLSLRQLAEKIAQHIPQFETGLWQWGKLSYREGESDSFNNNSPVSENCGMLLTDYEKAFSITINHYWNV